MKNDKRDGFHKTEVGWIPKDWNCIELGRACINGGKYGAAAPSIDYSPELPRYIRITDITDDGCLSSTDIKSIRNEDAKDYLLEEGDFLFARTGATVGKTYLHNKTGNFAFAGYLIRFVPNTELLLGSYLSNFTQSEKYWAWVRSTIHTGAQPNINAQEYSRLFIPLPSIDEQWAIIQILSTWDRAIERVQRLIEAKQRQKKGLMQGLLTGRLRFPEFGDPVHSEENIPIGWKTVEFHDCATRSKKKIDPVANDFNFRCVELEHISQETGKIIGETESKQQTSSKNYFRPGNVLFGKLRPYLHKFAFCDFEGVCSSEIWVLQNKSICTSRYLFYLIQTDTFLSASIQTTGTKMPRSDWNVVKKTKFALPNLEEQERITALLDQVELNIELLERYVMQLKQQKKGLMQKLLTGEIRVKVD